MRDAPGEDPHSGQLFLLANPDHTRLKFLVFGG